MDRITREEAEAMAGRLDVISRDFLHVPNDGMIEDYNHLQSAAVALRSLVEERDRLREALKPFDGRLMNWAAISHDRFDDLPDHAEVHVEVSARDVHRARAALKAPTHE